MNIQYTIQFFSEWHCGSGLAAGADVDELVIKDKNNLPFVPGKTLKGLVREAVEEILAFQQKQAPASFVDMFGNSKDKGCSFFKNAELPVDLRDSIITQGLSSYLYRSIASTAIDDKDIAKKNSLRKMQTVVPCSLEGEILNVPNDFVPEIVNGLKFIKCLGQNRNRGLGRCQITVNTKEGGNK
ncbi:MAG: RAMP superfamily CRISPR-associated protein [Bacteroidaceae bacterium]|nr:RAMP superfamily CRISPR-associated protein [Bacteroidaceae bacterium]